MDVETRSERICETVENEVLARYLETGSDDPYEIEAARRLRACWCGGRPIERRTRPPLVIEEVTSDE